MNTVINRWNKVMHIQLVIGYNVKPSDVHSCLKHLPSLSSSQEVMCLVNHVSSSLVLLILPEFGISCPA